MTKRLSAQQHWIDREVLTYVASARGPVTFTLIAHHLHVHDQRFELDQLPLERILPMIAGSAKRLQRDGHVLYKNWRGDLRDRTLEPASNLLDVLAAVSRDPKDK